MIFLAIDSGSDTRIMVSKVLEWSKNINNIKNIKDIKNIKNISDSKSCFDNEYFQTLNGLYNEFNRLVTNLINNSETNFNNQNKNNTNTTTTTNSTILEVKSICKEIRKSIQIISNLSKVDIEPPSLKEFLDKILELPSVVYTIVPGGNKNINIYFNVIFYFSWRI